MLSKNNFCILLLFICSNLSAQFSPDDFISEDENIVSSSYYNQILDDLSQNPLNINTASRKDLEELFWLSTTQIDRLIDLKAKEKIISFQQIRKAGFSKEEILQLKPFIIFSSIKTYNFVHQSCFRLKEIDLTEESSLNLYQRLKGSYKKYNFCFLHQKDPQEHDLLNFYSYFVEYQHQNSLEKIIFGKYRIAFGQGLLFAPKLGLSKSSATTSIPFKKFSQLKGYTSSYEIWALEGISAIYNLKHFHVMPFYSNTKLKADLSDGKISSFNETGIDLQDKKGNVQERIYGTHISYKYNKTNIGFSLTDFNFGKPFLNENYAEKYTGISSDFITQINNIDIYGEIAYVQTKTAFLSGIRWGENKMRYLLLFRNIPKYFVTWHANTFTSGNMENETGIYYGLTCIPRKKVKINLYVDLWKFPETRYFEKMSTCGNEEFIQLELNSKKRKISFSLKHKNKEKYKTIDDEAKIRDFQSTLIRINWWQYFEFFTFKTRFELANEYLPEEKDFKNGILVYEQIKYKYEKLEMVAQFTVYHTEILHYMYEHSLDGMMENSIFSGDGVQLYFLLKYHISTYFEVQFKILDNWNKSNKLKLALQFIMKI